MARFMVVLVLTTVGTGVWSPPGAAPALPVGAAAGLDSTVLARECEYGITVALQGDYGLADSVFVSLLSHAPGAAPALNNLGNLRLLQGQPDEALAFYGMAVSVDSADAGIHLNRALALWAAGRAAEAQAEGERGAQMAGGEAAAAALLGLRPESAEPAERGADVVGAPTGKTPTAAEKNRPYINRSEVRALLRGAAQRVPTAPARGDTSGYSKGRVASRPAGTRAADASDLQSVLYWKR